MENKKDYNWLKEILFLSLCILFLLQGCGGDKPALTAEQIAAIPLVQRTDQPKPSGGFVLTVAGETITAEEIVLPLTEYLKSVTQNKSIDQFKIQARATVEKMVSEKILNIVLYNQARKKAGENIDETLEKLAQAEVRRFVTDHNGDYALAEDTLKKEGLDWAGFKDEKKKMILIQNYISQQMPDEQPVTYSELMDYYNDVKEKFFITKAILTFQLIDIQPEKLETADPNQNKQQQAKELADQLVKRLHQGEDFGELAKKYSHGHRAAFGGLWKPVQPDSLAAPFDIIATEARKIQPGRITDPVETNGHFFIIKLIDSKARSVEPFGNVQLQLKNMILIDRRRKAINEFTEKLARQATVVGKDEFINFCLEEIYRQGNK